MEDYPNKLIMRLLTFSFFILFNLTLNSQNVKLDVQLITENDSIKYLIASLLSDSSCFINLETGFIGLTNSLNEFHLEVEDSTHYPISLMGGGMGHWFAPIIGFTDFQNDSMKIEIRNRFLKLKLTDGAISNVKKIFLYENQIFTLIYRLKFEETKYYESSLTTHTLYYELIKGRSYFLRLKYAGGEDKREVENCIKTYFGKIFSNQIKFYHK
jgi:hypothetical protein